MEKQTLAGENDKATR